MAQPSYSASGIAMHIVRIAGAIPTDVSVTNGGTVLQVTFPLRDQTRRDPRYIEGQIERYYSARYRVRVVFTGNDPQS